nr:MAG TPA_asm: hypothetical protein [Bacteriophage sp.]
MLILNVYVYSKQWNSLDMKISQVMKSKVYMYLQIQRRLLTIIHRKVMLNQMEQDSYR